MAGTVAALHLVMHKLLLAVLALGPGVGCQTQFTGSPHIEPAACQTRCKGINMQMSGMLYMGEYSSACLCELPKPGVPTATASASGAAGAAAGVVMQTSRDRDR